MTLSEYLAEYIASRGVDSVFEMIGGMSVRLIDAIYRLGKTRIVSVHHEQSAAFAICGWAQVTHVPGVAIATSGPGALNFMTGIATCYFDSIPAIFITGQVNQNELSVGKGLRQLGFQETDIVSIARPVTKYAVQLQEAQDITQILPTAFRIATAGRPGPVLIDIPMNLQKEEIVLNTLKLKDNDEKEVVNTSNDLNKFICKINDALLTSSSPLFLFGGGVKQAYTETLANELVEKTGIPAVYSLHGKGIIPSTSKYAAGLIGSYGNRWANKALADSDLLIVLGSRLDIRQTGADTEQFMLGKTIFHIDVSEHELNNRIKATEACNIDLALAMPELLEKLTVFQNHNWINGILENKAKWPDTEELCGVPGINPNYLLKRFGEMSNGELSGFVTDVGANQVWSAQSLVTTAEQFYLTSGSMGAMGYALPTAIGASIASGSSKVAVIAGDGGIQCNIQELELVKRLKLPLKILVINNRSLGMVRQFQCEYFNSQYPGTVWTYGTPDFVKIANAYGIQARTLTDPIVVDEALSEFISARDAYLLEVQVSTECGVYPKMQFGHKLNDMMPEKL